MRINKSLSALLLAALLGTALTACQRQEMPPRSDFGLPLPKGERSGAPLGPDATVKTPPQPGAGEAVDPHHPWIKKQPGLIEI